jgi:MFS superfamily sulfate permease-like transporter
MGRIPGEKAAWGSVARHPERRTIDGILVLRISAPLFWVNATTIEDEVMARLADAPGTMAVILDLEATNQLDITSADTLSAVMQRIRAAGVDVFLVRVMHQVRTVLRRTEAMEILGEDHMWHSISQGVRQARRMLGIKGWSREP